MLKNDLPALYANLLPREFLEQDSSETLATCDDCRMCKPELARQTLAGGSAETFLPSTKCCTYYPFVPNYLVGGILRAGGDGAEEIKNLLRRRQWILPIGVIAPPGYQKKFTDKRPAEFGRNADFLCPFYRAGRCAIWRFRDSECSTYFCAHQTGAAGRARWFRIGEQLFQVQMTLTQELLLQKGFTWPEIEANLSLVKITDWAGAADKMSYEMTATQWSRYWQHRADTAESFFRECYEWVCAESANLRTTLAPIFATTSIHDHRRKTSASHQ